MVEKPRDLWLTLGSIAMGILLFLVPRTGPVLVLCLLIIFALLIHPAWHFWWIERRLWRRVSLLTLLGLSLVFLGVGVWPSHEAASPATFDLTSVANSLVRLGRNALTLPWRWISFGLGAGFVIGATVAIIWARQNRKKVEAQLLAYQWLHEMANLQANNIALHVELERPFIYDAQLTDSMPSMGFKFPIRNWSVFDISVDAKVEGRIYLNGKPLGDPMLLKHNGQNFGFKELDGLSVEQRFTTTEANRILTSGALFSFTDLTITVKGGSRFPEVEPQPVTITSQHALGLDANLNEKSVESEEIAALKAEVKLCKDELAKLTGLAFTVDTKVQSDAKLRAHKNTQVIFDNKNAPIEVDMYILTTQLKVDFENNDINDRAFKRMELSLVKAENGHEEVIPFLEEPVMLSLDPDNNMEKQPFPKVVFAKQSTTTLWLYFNAHVPREHGERLDEKYFLRLSLHPLGQQPISDDLEVDWKAALKNATYISSRPSSSKIENKTAETKTGKPSVTGKIQEVYFRKAFNDEMSLVVSPDHYYDFDFVMYVYLANRGAPTTLEHLKLTLKANAQAYEGKKLSLADFYVVRPGLKDPLRDIEDSNDVPLAYTRRGWVRFVVRGVKRYDEDRPALELEVDAIDKDEVAHRLTAPIESEWRENSQEQQDYINGVGKWQLY